MAECEVGIWLDLANKFGIPMIILVLLIYTIRAIALWAIPRFDKWVDNYLAIMEQKSKTLEEASQRCVQMQQQTLNALEKILAHLEALAHGS